MALGAAALGIAAFCGPVSALPPGIPLLDLRPRPPLRAGPGHGYLTPEPAMLRALRPDVRIQAILTVGDTLAASAPGAEPYTLAPLPEAVGLLERDGRTAEALLTHGLGWRPGYGGSRVSRLLLDRANGGVLAADEILDGSEGYSRLGAAVMAGTREGFLRPQLLINEATSLGPRRGVVAAIDARDGTVRDLPWLGRFPHGATVAIALSTGRLAAVMTGLDDEAQGSRLYLYLAEGDADFLEGRGTLHVFRADAGPGGRPLRNPAAIRKMDVVTGRFVPVRAADPDEPLAWAEAAGRAGAFPFVRLGGAVPDRGRPNAFYFADRGESGLRDFFAARPYTGNGRIYHAELDPFDPTRVSELRVVLDGDEGDDLYRPDDLATDGDVLMIQEDPDEQRGLHPARVLRYDIESRRLDAIAACAERDSRGRLLPDGVGGAWASSGICDAGDVFGEDSWLLVVQARTLEQRVLGRRESAGQLLLVRGPRWKPPREQTRLKPDPASSGGDQ
jgi:hypothetical protein